MWGLKPATELWKIQPKGCNAKKTKRVGWSGDRIQAEAKFSHPFSPAQWSPHSLLHGCYRLCFPGVKRAGRGFDPNLAPKLKKKWTIIAAPSLGVNGLF